MGKEATSKKSWGTHFDSKGKQVVYTTATATRLAVAVQSSF